MKPSSYCVLFVMALLSECYINLAAMPAAKTEDTSSKQNALGPFLNEEVVENAFGPMSASRYAVLGASKSTRGGNEKVIIVDTGLWNGAQALARGLSLYKFQDLEGGQAPENVERRDTDQDPSSGIAIARRDMMRCMVGRVYRPCWEV
ncbi:hypothetical protein AAFF_G00185350 [Aldrovandia affinis]|uniref:Melanin-concentrating hormone n=1 Tax=Aldrovandia affinis TaxID=143900 RepID=A0AAD7W798_9TELE|nr:hypothetical protein AAFF_G00185350 [Aldrovandia affinis]